MDAFEDDFIPLAPPTKRLKRNSTVPAKKTPAMPKKASVKPPKKPHVVDAMDLDSSESPRDVVQTPNGGNLEFLNFLNVPASNSTKTPENDQNGDDEEDWDGVEFGDMPEDEENGAEKMEETDGGPADVKRNSGDAIELTIAAPKQKKEEVEKKETKKRKRVSEEPRKRRGSVQEREFALHFHNAQLLAWLGHAILIRREIESNRWHQALMVSYLPLPLFEEMSKIASSYTDPENSTDSWKASIRHLLVWFHRFFDIVEPLKALARKPQAPAPSRAQLNAGAAPKGKIDPKVSFNILKNEKKSTTANSDLVIRCRR